MTTTDYINKKGRLILIALSLKHKNDWISMYADIVAHAPIEPEWLERAKTVKDALTLLDTNYPQELQRSSKPPFVIYGVSTRG